MNDEESKQSLKTLSSLMVVLARMLKFCSSSNLSSHLERLNTIITEIENNHSENSEVISSLYKLTASIIETSQVYI